jgi:coenzyme F420-reducing hydrogenase alpha subunit
MAQRIVIDPVTRIEGHAKITLHLNDAGDVVEARFHVTEFRGFEKFCEGRPFREMPALTARICGICPVSHILASAKAGDALLAVEIPEAAVLLRRLMNLGQIIQSHALSFFHLSSPDLLLGYDAEPSRRNILGLAAAHPEVARQGVRLRQLGQQIVETLGGRRIPATPSTGSSGRWARTRRRRSPSATSRPSSSAWSRPTAGSSTTTAGSGWSTPRARWWPTSSIPRGTRTSSARRWSRGRT